MMTTELAVARDSEGYLINPEDWSEEVAQQLAQEEGITLTGDHWDVLRFMRQYWSEHQVAPDVRHVQDYLAQHGMDRKTAKEHLYRLFPYGYVKQACKLAGMIKPRAWSTG
ncbi:TusE/DsrC/DsvC family sulfur relay protein [Thiobacter aerophilum]|uniref:TusE/DsrC/DsvC family sulfur relay protein n=1 Tax=Thiobacter aerophilum TaxID=3121275 RepID=A0ABV0EI75_9BURK